MTLSDTIPDCKPANGRRAIFGHYASTTVGQGLILGLGVLTGILAARMLGPVGRGEYAAIIVWPLGVANFLALGINQAIAFNVGRRAFTVSEMATATTVIGLVQSALSILLGLIVVHFAMAKYSTEVRSLAVIFVLFTPVTILSGYPANFFQGLQDLFRFNLIRVAVPLAYMLGLVGLYIAHRTTLRSVIFVQISGFIVALVFGLGMVWIILRPRMQWNQSAIPTMISFGYRIQATNLTNYFNQRIDQLVLSLLVPPRQLGFYVVAVTLSTAVTVFPQAAGIVAFSRGSSQQSKDARETIGVSFRLSLIWLLVCCSLLYALAPFLIRFVFGPAYSGSILACRILLPGALMFGLKQVLYNGSGALGKPGLPSYAEGIGMAFTAIGLYLLVPRYGYIGAAIVSSVAYTVSLLVMLALGYRYLGLKLRTLLVGGR